MSSFYKKVTPVVPVVKAYSPVALVNQYGDDWRYFIPTTVSSLTQLALGKTTHDHYDGVLMGLMEKGVIGRVD